MLDLPNRQRTQIRVIYKPRTLIRMLSPVRNHVSYWNHGHAPAPVLMLHLHTFIASAAPAAAAASIAIRGQLMQCHARARNTNLLCAALEKKFLTD